MTPDRYGNIEIDTSGYENDPVDEFLKNKKENTSPGTYTTWVNTLKQNSSSPAFQEFLHARQKKVVDATVTDLEDFLDKLRTNVSDSTIEERLSQLASFYEELRELGVHDSNPAAYVLDQEDFDTEPPDRDYHTVATIGKFIAAIPDPQFRTATLMLAKTGMRGGELCNIDMCCLHLDDERYKEDYLNHHDIELVNAISHRPDTIYIDSDVTNGDIVRGDKRKNGSKRQRDTIIPIDKELKRSLLDWLSIRPRTPNPAHPLFTTTVTVNGAHNRLTRSSLYNSVIKKYAREAGLAEAGDNREDVDLHYFRHFFTTQMAKHRGDHEGAIESSLIKFMRGDVLDDNILDIYTHDKWGVNVRGEYLKNIYHFGIYD